MTRTHLVQVNEERLMLPNGEMVEPGQTVTLTPEQYDRIRPGLFSSGALTDLGATIDPGLVSVLDEWAAGGGGGGGSGFSSGTLLNRPAPSATTVGQHYYVEENDDLFICLLTASSGEYEWREVKKTPALTGSIVDDFTRSGALHGSLTSDGKATWGRVGVAANDMTTDGTYLRNDQVGTSVATIPTEWSDVEIIMELTQAPASWNGIVLRAPDANNYIQAGVNLGTEQAWFDVYVNGAYVPAESAGGVTVLTKPPLVMAVRAVGPELQLLVNDVVVLTHSTTVGQAATRHGLFTVSQTTDTSALVDRVTFAQA